VRLKDIPAPPIPSGVAITVDESTMAVRYRAPRLPQPRANTRIKSDASRSDGDAS